MIIMKLDYTRGNLYFRHYLWTNDERENNDAYDLDMQPLDVLQGYEVLIFANTFLNLYLPDHTVTDLHHLEYALRDAVPYYLKSKHEISAHLAKHMYLVRPRHTNIRTG